MKIIKFDFNQKQATEYIKLIKKIYKNDPQWIIPFENSIYYQ